MEHLTGTLTPIQGDVETVCENLCRTKYNVESLDYQSDWFECLCELSREYSYTVVNNKLYSAEVEILNPYGMGKVTESDDGVLNFHILYYNGGGSWSEVIEDANNRRLKQKS